MDQRTIGCFHGLTIMVTSNNTQLVILDYVYKKHLTYFSVQPRSTIPVHPCAPLNAMEACKTHLGMGCHLFDNSEAIDDVRNCQMIFQTCNLTNSSTSSLLPVLIASRMRATFLGSVYLPCKKRQLRPNISSLGYPVSCVNSSFTKTIGSSGRLWLVMHAESVDKK
jgi:hypothetical protein